MPLAISQLPPLDYRHGWNLSRFCDQIHLLHALMFNGSRMLFIAHDCSPWGNNSRTLTVSSRSTARMAQQPGLIFVTLCCLLQELLGRRSLIENPVGSDLFLSEQHLARHLRKLPYHVQNVDQCQFGANLEGFFKKKATTQQSNTPLPPAVICNGQHLHLHLRGTGLGGSRTAQSARCCGALCDHILIELNPPIVNDWGGVGGEG